MPHSFYFLRGSLGDQSLLERHQDAINAILIGDYTQKNIEKLQNHNVYSLRLGSAERLLFTTIKRNDGHYLLILDYLPSHDYHKSRFLRSGVLRNYIENNVETQDFIFETVSDPDISIPTLNNNTPENPELDYYNQNLITLNLEQQEASNVKLPAIISGTAGSGKTCVASVVLVSYTSSHPLSDETQGRALYVTKSELLVDSIKTNWEALPQAIENPYNLQFLAYDDLLKSFPGLSEKTFVDESIFNAWYKTQLNASKKITKTTQQTSFNLPAATVYQEFRICSAYNQDEYLALGNRQSSLNTNGRNALYTLYNKYLKFMNDSAQLDPNFYTMTDQQAYDVIVVDEAQDFSYLVLKNLSQLAKNRQIIYCMDSHQRLYDDLSVRPYLFQLLSLNEDQHISLQITHRCPVKIVAIANELIKFKHFLAGGIADKHEVTQITAINSEKDMGQVYALTQTQLHNSPWLMNIDSPNFAIVTTKNYKAEVKKHFKNTLIFTPEEIKGLEYETIFTYKLYDKNTFKQIQERLATLGDKKQPTNQAKSGAGDNQFGQLLNRIYTAYTRATKMLIIYEEATPQNQKLLTQFKDYLDAGLPLETNVQDQNSKKDWKKQVIQQLQRGNVGLAKNIFLAKVGGELSFDEFVQHQTAKKETPPSSPAPSNQHFLPIERNSSTSNSDLTSTPTKTKNSVDGINSPKITASKTTMPKITTSKTTKNLGKKSPNSVVIIEPHSISPILPSGAETQSKTLYQDFDLKRLTQALSVLDIKKLLLNPYLNHDEKPCSLLEFIQKDNEKINLFFSCIINNFTILKRIPLDLLIPYKNSLNPLFKEKWGQILMIHHVMEQLFTNNDDKNTTCTHPAVYSGNMTLIKILHSLGADFTKLDVRESSCAHALALGLSGNTSILNKLYEYNVPLNTFNADGLTPLHMAIANNRSNIVFALAKHNPELIWQNDKDEAPPVFQAAYYGNCKILRYLKQINVDLNNSNKEGDTPAHAAASMGHNKVLDLFVNYGMTLNQKNTNGDTLAHQAARHGHTKTLQYLNNYHIEHASLHGMKPLFLATKDGHFEIINAPDDQCGDFSINKKNYVNSTPAHFAAWEGHTNVLKFFQTENIAIHEQDAYGDTPTHLAAERGHLEIIQFFHTQGINFNQKNNDSNTPAHLAAQEGHTNIIQFFHTNGINLNQKNNAGNTPAHLAAKEGHPDIIRFFRTKGINLDQKNNAGNTPAHLAAQEGHTNIIQFFHTNGINLNQKNNDSNTPAHLAAKEGHPDIIRFFRTKGINLDQKNNAGNTPAHLAAQEGYIEVINVLINYGFDLTQENNAGNTPAHLAAKEGYFQIIRVLHQSEYNLTKKNKNGDTLLHLAICAEFFDSIKFMINNTLYFDPHEENNDGHTILHLLATADKSDIILLLNSNYADINLNAQDKLGNTPAHIAAYKNAINALQVLRDLGADLTIKNKKGNNVLDFLTHNQITNNSSFFQRSTTPLLKASSTFISKDNLRPR